MIKQWKSFCSLDGKSRRLLLQCFLLLALVSLTLRLVGLKHSSHVLSSLGAGNDHSLDDNQRRAIISRTLKMLGLACKYFPLTNCLIKSLVLWRLLLNQGLVCELIFGVKHAEHVKIDAHAWVEYKGVILNDRADIRDQYMVFNNSINSKL